MRHLCHISLRGSPGILKILIVHGLDKGIQLIAGVLEHRTDFGAVHGSRNRLAALSNHAIPVRAKLCDSLQVCGSRHEVVDDTMVIVQILQNIDTRTIGIHGELQLNLVAGAVLKVFRKLLCIDLKRARRVFNQRYLRLDSVEDSTPPIIAQVDVGLVGQRVQESAWQVRDIDGNSTNKMVEGRMTGTVPDGIQLSSCNDAVAELDVNALRCHVALIVVLQAVTARDSALLGGNDVHQTDINGQRDSFAATKEKVYSESLYYAPKKQKALVFAREGQTFTFTTDKSRRNLISKVVADNQLFFSVACTMNDDVCAMAMFWFRQMVYFSRDYSDIPRQLLEYSNDSNMLKAISDYAKAADVGIEDMKFEINSKEINEEADLPENIPDEVKAALVQFMHLLSETSNNSETHLKMGQVTATSMHQGEERGGRPCIYSMELSDESDGTRKLMALAPAIESVLSKGGLLLVDEIEKELHPALVDFIVSKFQSKRTNPNGAQIIFTTHSTELLSMELLRKDQLYFVDKDKYDGASELYSISDFSTRTTENIRKGYLLGKYGATPNVEIEEVE